MQTRLLLVFLMLSFFGFSQPQLDSDFNFGTEGWDELHGATLLKDGSLLLSGNVAGKGGSLSKEPFGLNDFWIQKSSIDGVVIWENLFGGFGEDRLWMTLSLDNGNLLLCGDSDSGQTGNKQSPGYGGLDYWVLMLDENGNVLWEKTYGSQGDDRLFCAEAHPNGGFVLAGFSNGAQSGIKEMDSFGGTDLWILHIDDTGEVLWQKQYGGTSFDNVYQIRQHGETGFLLGGATNSPINHNSVSMPSFGDTDYWLLKIDFSGEKLWDKRYGGSGSEQVYILETTDEEILLAGGSTSGKNGSKQSESFGSYDYWVLKLDKEGQILWENTFGGASLDVAYDAVMAKDGSVYLAGVSDSDISGNKKTDAIGGYDFWMIKCDADGTLAWDQTFGGTDNDALTQLIQHQDGSFTMVGHSSSESSNDKNAGTYGLNDIWIAHSFCAADLDLPSTATYCQGTDQEVEALSSCDFDCNILWNNELGNSIHTFKAEEASTIEAVLFDKIGCTATASFSYDISAPLEVSLGGSDTLVFKDQHLLIGTPAPPNSTWAWSTGDDNPFIKTTETGDYSVTVTDSNGCTGSDTIAVCHCLEDLVFIPNVFRPEDDWLADNSYWFVQAGPGAVESILVAEVYTKEGQLAWKSDRMRVNDNTSGWDGRSLGGKRLDPGIYTYHVKIAYQSGQEETIFGTVLLIR